MYLLSIFKVNVFVCLLMVEICCWFVVLVAATTDHKSCMVVLVASVSASSSSLLSSSVVRGSLIRCVHLRSILSRSPLWRTFLLPPHPHWLQTSSMCLAHARLLYLSFQHFPVPNTRPSFALRFYSTPLLVINGVGEKRKTPVPSCL